ncbi:hypothetical protein [Actinomadura luteofluorescens]|uniref:hypothetical protein n=1 Tax=Actinomadura luteofluorescens TaxID=46163 RepID=UPI0030D0900E
MREIEELYAAFAHVPRPAAPSGCPCCVDPEEGQALLRRRPRDLGVEELSRYAAKVLNTWGGPEDLRYFAPRLLELAAADAFIWPDPEIVFGKFAQAGWRTWDQRDTLAAFFDAFWTRTLERFPNRPSVDTSLCALAAAEADVPRYLDEWGRLASEAPIRHLHEFAVHGLTWTRGTPRLSNAFWDASAPPYRQVVDWLTGGPAAEAVAAAFARTDDEAVLHLLAETDSALLDPGAALGVTWT